MNTLAAVAAPVLDGAQCIGLFSLFDEPDRDDPDRREVVESAQRLCSTCPALADCRAWLDALPPDQRPTGVVAGQFIKFTKTKRKATP